MGTRRFYRTRYSTAGPYIYTHHMACPTMSISCCILFNLHLLRQIIILHRIVYTYTYMLRHIFYMQYYIVSFKHKLMYTRDVYFAFLDNMNAREIV
jgi:hypothetical protein